MSIRPRHVAIEAVFHDPHTLGNMPNPNPYTLAEWRRRQRPSGQEDMRQN